MTTPNDMDANTDVATAISPAPPAAQASPQATCRNCNAPLQGPHCHACGQPVSGLVRPLGNLFGDLMDSVFDLDLRILRSIGPLFRKPGFLTREYFAGRQIRYVTPVRLFFFLCILAFFFARFTINVGPDVVIGDKAAQDSEIGAAMTEAQVIERRDAVLAAMAKGKAALADSPGRAGAATGFDAGAREARRTADLRLKSLRDAAAKGEPAPLPMDQKIIINGSTWDETTNPVHVFGAPVFVDAWVNGKIRRAVHNLGQIQADPAQYADAFVGAIPTALFVLVPIFALMLKLAFLFKRRLYMEHLVVALHSHAFLSLDLLLIFTGVLLQRLVPEDGMLDNVLGWSTGLLMAWVPIYLLIMQKRVYQQGWPMTLLKFFALGTTYVILLGFAVAGAGIASLVSL